MHVGSSLLLSCLPPLPLGHLQEVTASGLGALGGDRSMPAPRVVIFSAWLNTAWYIPGPAGKGPVATCQQMSWALPWHQERGGVQGMAGSSMQARWVLASAKVGCSCQTRRRKEQW